MNRATPTFRPWCSLAISSITLFLALWIVVPAPNRTFLTFAVGGPEVSPWLAMGAIVALSLAIGERRQPRVVRIALGFALVSLLLAAMPLARYPATSRRFDAAMRAGLGDGYLGELPVASRAGLRARRLDLGDLATGIASPDVAINRAIEFARPDGVPLTVNIYRPSSPGPHAVVIQIYGGSWQRGDPSSYEWFSRHLAARGYVVFAIDYRHAPQWRWPAQIDDVETAVSWVCRHAAEYGGDTARMAVIGRSAGAHLALLAAYRPGGPTPFRAVISLYGPVDLIAAYASPPRPDPLRIRSSEEALIGGRPAELPERYREASPITYVTRPLPPTLIIQGARDHVVEARFARTLDARLRATGTRSVLLEIPWAEHAFDAVSGGLSSQLALYHLERFLAWALSRP